MAEHKGPSVRSRSKDPGKCLELTTGPCESLSGGRRVRAGSQEMTQAEVKTGAPKDTEAALLLHLSDTVLEWVFCV